MMFFRFGSWDIIVDFEKICRRTVGWRLGGSGLRSEWGIRE